MSKGGSKQSPTEKLHEHLHMVFFGGEVPKPDKIKKYIAAGADPNTDYNGLTWAMLASRDNNDNLLRIFLDAKIDLNKTNPKNEFTILDYAVTHHAVKAAAMIIQHDNSLITANILNISIKNHHREIRNLMLNALSVERLNEIHHYAQRYKLTKLQGKIEKKLAVLGNAASQPVQLSLNDPQPAATASIDTSTNGSSPISLPAEPPKAVKTLFADILPKPQPISAMLGRYKPKARELTRAEQIALHERYHINAAQFLGIR